MKNEEKYTKDIIPPLDFTEHVKKRPFMYIGSIIELFFGLIDNCIELTKTDKILFKITLIEENDFSINISTEENIESFLEYFENKIEDFENHYLPKVLKVISKKFSINKVNNSETSISFSFDKAIIKNTDVDYQKLSEKALLISVLNKQTEILTTDKRQKYLSQNYYHFPKGLFYLFDRVNKEALGKPKFKITFEETIDLYEYKIGIAYRTDWYPNEHIQSFANNIETKCGGSLVDGIFNGLFSACKNYVKTNNLTTHKIKRKKMLNGLIIICSIRGHNLKYGGSFKETLENKIIYKKAKKIIETSVLDFMNENKEITTDFLMRFDKTHLTSGIY